MNNHAQGPGGALKYSLMLFIHSGGGLCFLLSPRNKTAMNTKDIGRKPRHRQPLWVETRGGEHYIFTNGKPYILSSHVATGKFISLSLYIYMI